jgi:protein phosphatase
VKLTFRYAGLTDPGLVRQSNEDNWTADPDQGLFIVADGMGGEFAGALASKVVVETLPGLIRSSFADLNRLPAEKAKRRMKKAIADLSSTLCAQSRNEPGLEGMGSTVVCALIRDDRLLLGYMGDSRAYRLRKGRLRQLTIDHTLIQLLVISGEIKPAEAASHPARGQLTRNVGMAGQPLPDTRLITIKPGDLLLLCSDGLTGMLDDDSICSILSDSGPLEMRCQRLVDAANQRGGRDNVTVLLFSVVPCEGNGLAQ